MIPSLDAPLTTRTLVGLRQRAREAARMARLLNAAGHRAAALEMTEAAILLGSVVNILRKDFDRAGGCK
ncbi:hypothetical protein MKI84_08440 [Ancylobacter sp. A5.8]|uniref:hypothetical protein n=1 Tax=Ancylobacter gelatini TaxID=2919920 RepID=UPI001F4E5C99|nr:hypothetical protein [Ancylobacter gelatini]MCJ8142943.1 hypothetical protein [Ancylobacter gelatini]